MSGRLDPVAWPAPRLGDALAALVVRAGLAPGRDLGGRSDEVAEAWFDDVDGPLDAWVAATAARCGAEAEPVRCDAADAEAVVRRVAPAVIAYRGGDGARRLVAVLRRRGARCVLLTPDLGTAEVRVADVTDALRREVVAPAVAEVGSIVDALGVPEERRAAVARALADRVAARRPVRGLWLVRAGADAPLRVQAREDRLGRLAAILAASHAVQSALWIASWALLGHTAFAGQVETAWIVAWGLVLLAILPFRVVATAAGGRLAQGAGALLRRRMLQGALRLELEEVRHEGVGSLLGQAMETDQIEQAAVSGALHCVTSAIELVLAGVVLSLGAGGPWMTALLAVWCALAAAAAWRSLAARRRWTETRLRLTNDFVERMVGNRTRVTQLAPERWYDGEDADLESYLAASRALDAHSVRLDTILARSWLVAGVAAVAPAFVASEPRVEPLAIALGGVFLAYQALRGLGVGLDRAVGARVAWERVRALWRAAARSSNPGLPGFAARAAAAEVPAGAARPPVLEALGVQLTHRARATPVLRGLDLVVRDGDRILLEGSSGAGKSSLAAVLSGCRRPDAGLLLLRGLDRGTCGDEAWRRRAVVAPQFHENHVLLGTLAFNLLLGRRWPPEESDLREADEVCRGLGLGPVLDRMPGGLRQMVGETGWQLSHGEQCRVFLARTLLQGADLVLLDETFAALDPATFERCLAYAKQRTRALVVIAHR